MRVSDDRYRRDLRRHYLAVRFLRHDARTQTICTWTGLSYPRVRRLYRSIRTNEPVSSRRLRGPSPQRVGVFFRGPRLRSEAAALAGMCRELGIIPSLRVPGAG